MRYIKLLAKAIVLLPVVALFAVVITSFSLVYNFQKPAPFSGNEIFNPYRNLDTAHCWKRANFHTHTRVDGPLNECDYTPEQTLEFYNSLSYDIVTFSNHNKQTVHPTDSSLQVNLYEHGYNLCKFHKLVFGSSSVWHFDNLLPLFASQKQFQIEQLLKQSDIVVLNHPLRTHTLNNKQLEKISGYQIIELDSGKSTENGYWDAALSAGIYSFGLANDDLHHPDRTRAIAVRCNFLCTPTAEYSDIRHTLLDGCYYSMRVPDYGDGDWEQKREQNRHLPYIRNIGLQQNNIFISLSEAADSIKVTGQGQRTLAVAYSTDSLGYAMAPTDSYGRFTAYFADGEVIYSNPFARYDSHSTDTPFRTTYSVNALLTVLYNTIIALIALLLIYKTIKLW